MHKHDYVCSFSPKGPENEAFSHLSFRVKTVIYRTLHRRMYVHTLFTSTLQVLETRKHPSYPHRYSSCLPKLPRLSASVA